MTDLSKQKVLFYDLSIFSEVCNRLGRDFGKAYYFVPWIEAFPTAVKAIIGTGFEHMERVKYFWDYVDKVDLICFPDTHCSDIYQFLKDNGYPVAGVGQAEILELDRKEGRETQRKVGLPTQKTDYIKGIKNLDLFLQKAKKVVIKLSIFRGNIETWSQDDYNDSEPKLARLMIEWGPLADELIFVVEGMIDGVEPGLDNILYQGEVISPTMLAFELKGCGYIAKVIPYNEIPTSVKLVSDKMAPILKKMNYSFWNSTEIIVDKKKDGYFIDPCHRLAAPCINAVQQELIKNYSMVWWQLGHGEKPTPEYGFKFAAGAAFYSEWIEQGNWARIRFDKKFRDFIKFREAAQFNGVYWVAPKAGTACSVVGLGNTIKEAIEKAQEVGETVRGVGCSLDKASIDFKDITEKIEEAKKFGIIL